MKTILLTSLFFLSALISNASKLDQYIQKLEAKNVTILDFKQQYDLLKVDKEIPPQTGKLLLLIQKNLLNNERKNRLRDLDRAMTLTKLALNEAQIKQPSDEDERVTQELRDRLTRIDEAVKIENSKLLTDQDLHQLYHECLIEYAYRAEHKLLTLAEKYYKAMMKQPQDQLILKPEFILKMEKINPDYFPPATLTELIKASKAKSK